MQTELHARAIADPHIAEANQILRKCVHCGFCTATCPTYVLLGDELDQPARAHLSHQEHAGAGEAATAETVKHLDRCLSCLSCMTTCPSGVHYMHLIDDARVHVEKTYQAPARRPADARAARLRDAASRSVHAGAAPGAAGPAAGAPSRAAGRQAPVGAASL